MPRAVATLSGGLDSGVAAALFRIEGGGELACGVFFDYGQRARVPERRAARALAARMDVPLREIELPWLAELAEEHGSALLPGGPDLPEGLPEKPGDEESARAVWIPARNAVFVAIGAAVAEVCGAEWVVTGFNREEAATFADNSEAFVEASSAMLRLGTRNAVRVTSPTLAMDKAEIVAVARRLGFRPEDFWSCYRGGAKPCGRCESCLRGSW